MSMKAKRVILSVPGVLVSGVSVGIFKLAAFGVDPFQSLMSGLDALIPISFGTLYVIVNALLLVFALVFDRHYIGIATFINLFLLGIGCYLLSGGEVGQIAAFVGIGTVLTAFFMGPLVDLFNRKIAQPLLKH